MTFTEQFWGSFQGILNWSQLDELWQTMQIQSQAWYLYQPYQPLPQTPLTPNELQQILTELNEFLRKNHPYDYCGIVYANSVQLPSLVKVFHPNHLGASCGSSGEKILPQWIFTQLPPERLELPTTTPSKWQRWWPRWS
ncbi:hypothetical protein [Thioflexithrix psekupsensis]|uniref:Uncharacterized protein n=1 Tax=Thioflexithrix psekupsensis TaxID=1570016 RepID=A0A251X549_9GAMM|nr:hypothetical protein [Thioflexithrix psekupsensis]OUD12516.1 hypothetical protein TPSD3_15605 [Thioflexithrix psekupsensis]